MLIVSDLPSKYLWKLFLLYLQEFYFHICVGVLEAVLEILKGVRTKQPPQHPEKPMITSDRKNLFSQIMDDILWHSFQQGIATSFLTFKEGRNPFLNAH